MAPEPSTADRPVTPPSRHTAGWERLLRDAQHLDAGHLLGLGPGGATDLLALVAHPDDETLAMGATLAAAATGGARVHVVVLTRGEAALDHVGLHPAGLPARRVAELDRAAAALGATGVTCLDLPDGSLAEHETRARQVLQDALAGHRFDHVLTTWRHDPHPDHQAAGRLAIGLARDRGVQATELVLWGPHWTDPAELDSPARLVHLAHDDVARRRKARALACYTSQVQPPAAGLGPILPADVLAWRHEVVVRP